MMRAFVVLVALVVSASWAGAADAAPFKGQFKFTSKAPKEDIFGTADGKAELTIKADDLGATRGVVTVPVATMKTGNETRDEHMKSPDWLDASKFPEIKFEITSVEIGAPTTEGEVTAASGKVTGKFTLHGVTTDLTAPATIKWKADGKAKITTQFTIKLADYKVAGKDNVVGSKVGETITCEVALVGSLQ